MPGTRFFCAILLVAAAAGAYCDPAPLPGVQVETVRTFGQTVGGIIEQRLTIALPSGFEFAEDALPSLGPVTDWLDLRSIAWSKTSARQVDVQLAYLILKGVRNPEPVAIPALTLNVRQAAELRFLEVPQWAFTLLPVIPPSQPDAEVTLRGMLPARIFPLRPHLLALAASLLGLAACGASLMQRLGLLRACRSKPPFRRTLGELRRLQRLAADENHYGQALKLIHRSLEATAGRVVFASDIDDFFVAHPAFKSLQTQFGRFFAASEGHFFGSGVPQQPITERWSELEDLCRRCARVEAGRRR